MARHRPRLIRSGSRRTGARRTCSRDLRRAQTDTSPRRGRRSLSPRGRRSWVGRLVRCGISTAFLERPWATAQFTRMGDSPFGCSVQHSACVETTHGCRPRGRPSARNDGAGSLGTKPVLPSMAGASRLRRRPPRARPGLHDLPVSGDRRRTVGATDVVVLAAHEGQRALRGACTVTSHRDPRAHLPLRMLPRAGSVTSRMASRWRRA